MLSKFGKKSLHNYFGVFFKASKILKRRSYYLLLQLCKLKDNIGFVVNNRGAQVYVIPSLA